MGRGDKSTKRGKISRGSYGKTRRPSGRKQKELLVPKPAAKPAPQPVSEQSPAQAAK